MQDMYLGLTYISSNLIVNYNPYFGKLLAIRMSSLQTIHDNGRYNTPPLIHNIIKTNLLWLCSIMIESLVELIRTTIRHSSKWHPKNINPIDKKDILLSKRDKFPVEGKRRKMIMVINCKSSIEKTYTSSVILRLKKSFRPNSNNSFLFWHLHVKANGSFETLSILLRT